MSAGLLQITRYETSEGPYDTETIRDPSWAEVEASIRALDRNLRPFIWMYRSAAADEDELPEFEVSGGKGAWFLGIRGEDYEWFIDDPDQGEEDIEIWESDQGASFPARQCCFDLARVLAAAKCFYETGEPMKDMRWA